MQEPNLIELGVHEIEATANTQVRKTLDKGVIKRYAGWYKSGALFPPLVVFSPQGSERYILADGFHRLGAAIEAGLDSIACDLKDGDVREALAYALGANEDHGVPRTAKDIRNAIEIACKDPVWSEWSNRQIAALVKVHHKTVGTVRDELHLTPEKVKTGQTKKDGTPVEQKTKKEKVEAPEKSIDKGNRKDLIDAMNLFMSLPFDGDEAVERLKLYDMAGDFEYCREWFEKAENAARRK